MWSSLLFILCSLFFFAFPALISAVMCFISLELWCCALSWVVGCWLKGAMSDVCILCSVGLDVWGTFWVFFNSHLGFVNAFDRTAQCPFNYSTIFISLLPVFLLISHNWAKFANCYGEWGCGKIAFTWQKKSLCKTELKWYTLFLLNTGMSLNGFTLSFCLQLSKAH